MQRPIPLLEGETYHIYNRGANKADVFLSENDYSRFKLLLFLGNHTHQPFRFNDLVRKYRSKGIPQGPSLRNAIFEGEMPDRELVDVLAYALMPNHFHLILRQKSKDGITKFMKKVGTAYSMYFNKKREHSGTVFQGRFQSRHVDTGDYLRWLFAYVALNPLDVGFPGWKDQGIADPQKAFAFLHTYNHASFPDMHQELNRPERAILSFPALEEVEEDVPDFSDIKELLEVERTEIERTEK